MFATATQIDPALALAIGDAVPCGWQDHPSQPVCGARAVWIARLTCGCQHLCCTPHKQVADLETRAAQITIAASLAIGQPAFALCITCLRPIFDFTITWEPI